MCHRSSFQVKPLRIKRNELKMRTTKMIEFEKKKLKEAMLLEMRVDTFVSAVTTFNKTAVYSVPLSKQKDRIRWLLFLKHLHIFKVLWFGSIFWLDK